MFVSTPSKLGEHGKNKLGTQYIVNETKEKGKGAHAEVVFAKTPKGTRERAVKKQLVKSPYNPRDRTYRELQIMHTLSQLKNTECFVQMHDWFKLRADKENTEPLSDEEEYYLFMVMESAEKTLDSVKNTLNMNELQSILFQVLFGLAVAQREVEFNHLDLHFKNILLNPLSDSECTQHSLGKNTWFTTSYSVRICDYGHSRLKVPETGEVLYNPKSLYGDSFLVDVDVHKLQTELKSIKKVETDDEDMRKMYIDLKKKMSKEGMSPEQLLEHPFFDSLRIKPKSAAVLPPPSKPLLSPVNAPKRKYRFRRKYE